MHSEQNPNEKGRRSPVTTILILSLVLGGAIFLLNRVITASAFSSYLTSAEAKYPNIVGSRIDNCALCHMSDPPSATNYQLNPYGTAYKNIGSGNSATFGLIEAIDSDGDGFTNIQEINALTFPGNAGDLPQAPTNTPTAIPPTATTVPPTNTSVPPTPTNPAYPPPATATAAPTTGPTVAPTTAPTTQPTTAPTTEPTVGATSVGATMVATETEEVEETEQPEGTEQPEHTKVAVTRTPRPTKTVSPARTPRATRVYPTRQATPTMVCVRDDDDKDQNSFNGNGSEEDGYSGIRCPDGYHVLGQYESDYTNYHLKPSYNFYSRRNR